MPTNRSRQRASATPQNWNPSKMPSAGSTAIHAPRQEEMDALVRERLDLHAQLFEAAQIQRKLSGQRTLHCGSMQFANEVFAARYLSGDFTILSRNGASVFTTLGDIAGKGFAAGMWFTNLAGLLQSYGRPGVSPASTASEINRHLCYLRPMAPFVTAFLAQIDCLAGEVIYCNAGHFPPIVLRSDGETELLETGGALLGAVEGAKFESGHLVLERGDKLVAYSDGVLECPNVAGEEFGTTRLMEALQLTSGLSAQNTLLTLLASVQDFANGNPPCDDISLTVIQRDFEGYDA